MRSLHPFYKVSQERATREFRPFCSHSGGSIYPRQNGYIAPSVPTRSSTSVTIAPGAIVIHQQPGQDAGAVADEVIARLEREGSIGVLASPRSHGLR